MGNKSSAELWENMYKLQEKEFLAFNDTLTEKFQMGELDSQDKKGIQKFKDEFHASITSDRGKLVDAIWQVYAKEGKVMGREQCRNIIKDALTQGKTHLPKILVALCEVEAMRTTQKDSTALMLDKEARPLLEKSLDRIRRDCSERVKNSLGESLDDVNTIGDSLLLRLTAVAPDKDKKDAKAPVLDTKATVKQDVFMKLFHAASQESIGLKELIQSVLAQFTNFLQIELRNIPLRVIKKLEEAEEAAEAEAAKNAGDGAKKA
jgi:hypothetical protein